MKKVYCCILGMLGVFIGRSQFYYTDIITTQQTNAQYLLLKQNKIHTVSAKSYDPDQQLSPDFKLEQVIAQDQQSITTNSLAVNTGNTISTSYYHDNRLVKTIDSSENLLSIVQYEYDSENNIVQITTTTTDHFMGSRSEEKHEWFYENGQPKQMIRIKNNTDTTFVTFEKDNAGNISAEKWTKQKRLIEQYYYYYNEANLLTDIVRYNSKAKRLLPDFTFDYDTQDRVVHFTQVLNGAANYLSWLYVYLPNGLKDTESCFDKQKLPVGKIVFEYQTF